MVEKTTATQILEKVKNGQFTIEQAQEQLAQLKLGEIKPVTFKVSPKGAVSIYGIRRMPITLYRDELKQIDDTYKTPQFQKFLSDNTSSLSLKKKGTPEEKKEEPETQEEQETASGSDEVSPSTDKTPAKDTSLIILEQLKNGTLSIEEAQQKLTQLKLTECKQITYKVSPKGAISIYGIRRMPISLYKDELKQIEDLYVSQTFQQFLTENASQLNNKKKVT